MLNSDGRTDRLRAIGARRLSSQYFEAEVDDGEQR